MVTMDTTTTLACIMKNQSTRKRAYRLAAQSTNRGGPYLVTSERQARGVACMVNGLPSGPTRIGDLPGLPLIEMQILLFVRSLNLARMAPMPSCGSGLTGRDDGLPQLIRGVSSTYLPSYISQDR